MSLDPETEIWISAHGQILLYDLLHEGVPCPCMETKVSIVRRCSKCEFRAGCRERGTEKNSAVCRYMVYHEKDVPTEDELFEIFKRCHPKYAAP